MGKFATTWSRQDYFDMISGDCVNATLQSFIPSHIPTSWTFVRRRRTTQWADTAISVVRTGIRADSYHCSHLSTAPTTEPTTAPTTARGLLEENLWATTCFVVLTLLVCIAIAFLWWWHRCRERLEPYEQAAMAKANERCDGDSTWAQELRDSENLCVSVEYLTNDDQFTQDAIFAAHEAQNDPDKYKLWHPEQLDPGAISAQDGSHQLKCLQRIQISKRFRQ